MEKPNCFRRRSSFEMEQLKKLKDKKSVIHLCTRFGKNVLDFIMD